MCWAMNRKPYLVEKIKVDKNNPDSVSYYNNWMTEHQPYIKNIHDNKIGDDEVEYHVIYEQPEEINNEDFEIDKTTMDIRHFTVFLDDSKNTFYNEWVDKNQFRIVNKFVKRTCSDRKEVGVLYNKFKKEVTDENHSR